MERLQFACDSQQVSWVWGSQLHGAPAVCLWQPAGESECVL